MELLVGQGQDPSVHIRQRERWVGGRGFRWLDRDVIARHILPNNLGSTKARHTGSQNLPPPQKQTGKVYVMS